MGGRYESRPIIGSSTKSPTAGAALLLVREENAGGGDGGAEQGEEEEAVVVHPRCACARVHTEPSPGNMPSSIHHDGGESRQTGET
jgi:hypothetical protein